MTDQDHIDRINALTSNARTTWFGLLIANVFIAVTLMGTVPSDFYGQEANVPLPFANIDVNTRLYFFSAPILLASVYAYFHLYLIRLTDALSEARFRVAGLPLSKAISPWLISDAALHLRRKLRREPNLECRSLEAVAAFINLLITWALCPVVLLLAIYVSISARSFTMSMVSHLSLSTTFLLGFVSAGHLHERLSKQTKRASWNPAFWGYSGFSVILFVGMAIIYKFTAGESTRNINLSGLEVVERPENWQPYRLARADYQAEWCLENSIVECRNLDEAQSTELEASWKTFRALQYQSLTNEISLPDNASKFNLSRTFAVAYDFSRTKLEENDFSFADLEASNFRSTTLLESTFVGAEMSQVQLTRAKIYLSNFGHAQLKGATLSQAIIVKGTSFRSAQMEEVDLRRAQMEDVDLSGANFKAADLSWATMQNVDLSLAQMEGANLSFSFLSARRVHQLVHAGLALGLGRVVSGPSFQGLDLKNATNEGGAMRHLDLRKIKFNSETDFRNVFIDGTVLLPVDFRESMGGMCQIKSYRLSDEEFFGRWRGWIEKGYHSWQAVSPPGFEDVEAIKPPEDCHWKTGPMPASK